MKARIFAVAVAAVVAVVAQDAHGIGKNEKGCLVGGVAGGVGGHLLGDHAVLGAAGGCAVGAVVANERDKKEQAKKKHDEDVAKDQRRKRRHTETVRNDTRTTY